MYFRFRMDTTNGKRSCATDFGIAAARSPVDPSWRTGQLDPPKRDDEALW